MKIKTDSRWMVLAAGVVWLGASFAAQAQVASSSEAESAVVESKIAYPPSLKPLFSEESGYQARCRFVQALGCNLPEAEVSALLEFIAAAPESVGLTRDQFNSVADKVVIALEQQVEPPSALVDLLMTMFRDQAGDFTWRDYCVQHLGALYASTAADTKREPIRAVWDEAIKPEAKMAGTVVLALRRNVGQEGIAKQTAADQAAAVALSDQQPETSRLTAIQVAAELGNRDMLPLAREIVESKQMVSFRMSAMATIGMLGSAADLELLNKYTDSSDMRLRTASRAAVKKIEARLGK